jgi:hypothetical protein
MVTQDHRNVDQLSERAPLLQSISDQSSTPAIKPAIDENDVRVSEVVGQGALGPEISHESRKTPSHGNADARREPETTASFAENGLLEGISKTKFRLIYGGILLGYFVSCQSRKIPQCAYK